MIAVEGRIEASRPPAVAAPELKSDSTLMTVKVYTRHRRTCPRRDRSEWARCNCVKWLYIYRDGKYKLINAKTRCWEGPSRKRERSATLSILLRNYGVSLRPRQRRATQRWRLLLPSISASRR